MAGRIEVYVHGDKITPHKGMCAIEVCCQTDFAARTPEFIGFCEEAVKQCYTGSYADKPDYSAIIVIWPELETRRVALEAKLKEKIWIRDIKFMQLTSDKQLRNELAGAH